MAVTIKAVVMWAQLDRVNEMSGKYQVDLTNLSDAAVAALESEGIEPGFTEEKQHFVTCKSQRPIVARDADRAVLTGINIGNGSTAVAVIKPYAWTFKGKKGVSASLEQLVITELVEYEDDDVSTATLDEAL